MYKRLPDIKNIQAKLETKDTEKELLNERIKAAYRTIEVLRQRVNELEYLNTSNSERQSRVIMDAPPPSCCLLLGVTNIWRVLRSDIGENCSVKTIYGANIDLLRSWITEQLNRTPTPSILHCGINNILDESPHENILDNLGLRYSSKWYQREKLQQENICIPDSPPYRISRNLR